MYQEAQYLRLKARVEIDKLRIDEELVETPMLLLEASEGLAEVTLLHSSLLREKEAVYAARTQDIRDTPDSDGKLPSEAKVTNMIRSLSGDQTVQAAAKAVDEVRMDISLWEGLVSAYKEKQFNIRKIADLMISGIMSNASVYEQERSRSRRTPLERS